MNQTTLFFNASPNNKQQKSARLRYIGFQCLIVFILLSLNGLHADEAQNPRTALHGTFENKPANLQQLQTELSERIRSLEQIESPSAQKKDELSWLRKANDYVQQTLISIDRTQSHVRALQQAPLALKTVQEQLPTPIPESIKLDKNLPLETVESQLETAKSELDNAQRRRETLDAEATQRLERQQSIIKELSTAQYRLNELNQILITPPANRVSGGNGARQEALAAEQTYLRQYIEELQQENQSYDARRELLRARRQLAEKQVLAAEKQVTALERAVSQLRTEAAAQVVQAADASIVASANAHPLIRIVTDENRQLASELAHVLALTTRVAQDQNTVSDLLSVTRRQFDSIQEKVTQIGLTDAIGLKLRNDRNQLPDIAYYRTQLKAHREAMNHIQLKRLELEDRLVELVDIEREARRLVDAAQVQVTEVEQQELLSSLQTLLEEQKTRYLPELIKAYDTYFNQHLFPLMEKEQLLIEVVRDYKKLIDSHILWIQSASLLNLNDIKQLTNSVQWLLSVSALSKLAVQLGKDLLQNPTTIIPPLLLITLLLITRRRLKRKQLSLSRSAGSLHTATLTNILLSIVLTLLSVIPWPLLMYLIAWRTGEIHTGSAHSSAIAAGLMSAAWVLFFGLLVRRFTAKSGLYETHFDWSKADLLLIRQQWRWYFPLATVLVFVLASTLSQSTKAHQDSLGRIAFLAFMFCTAWLVYRLTRPTTGLLKNVIEREPGSWVARLSGIWFPALVATPLALALAALLGYQYTAVQIGLHLAFSTGLIFVIALIKSLLIRGLRIAQYQLSLQAAEASAPSSPSQNKTFDETPSSGELVHAEDDKEPKLDAAAINAQTMRLLNSVYWIAIIVGLYVIWSGILPAFNLLNDIVLWQNEISGSGSDSTTQVPVTLANLLLAVVVLIMTFFVSRNIPGLLEIAILQRLPFSPSARYAIATIVRYALIIIGLAMTFSAIGIGWSKVQWLAAAITVGLGFGLQEIFANFVSGLIILFERQIRVGDVVTVGDISGRVTGIQMRATTITDWDRKELIIPNKEFVTGQVINWSLSDTILRLVIPVGIAYGSNTHLAYDTLLAVARNHPNVLDEPAPTVRFMAFGASSLDFELRVFIPHIDFLLDTKHELHMEIDQQFRAADIEIAFPQRDIHIRDITPFDPKAIFQKGKEGEQ